MPTPSHDEAHEPSLIYIVGRLNQGIRREMSGHLGQWRLSVQEYTTLSVLKARPGLSNAQLARRALVTPQSMLEILGKLEDRGLVQRQADPAHARILKAKLTRKGVALLSKADPEIASIQERMLADIPASQRQIIVKGMAKAMEKLSSGLAP